MTARQEPADGGTHTGIRAPTPPGPPTTPHGGLRRPVQSRPGTATDVPGWLRRQLDAAAGDHPDQVHRCEGGDFWAPGWTDGPCRPARIVAAHRAILGRHGPFEGRCVFCVEWCDCAVDRLDCVHGNRAWPCPDVRDLLSAYRGRIDPGWPTAGPVEV